MRKLLLSAAFVLGLSSAASATCTSPAVMHDFPGTAFNMSLATAPDGNCASNLSFPNSTATGSITSTQSVTLTPSGGQSAVGIQVTGTWTGTLFVEASIDGTNFIQTTVVPVLSDSVQSATITASGMYQANLAGFASFRIRGNSVASGTAVVTLIGTSGIATVMADNPFPVTGYTGMTALNVVGNTTIGSATTDKPLMLGGSSTGASGGNAQVAKVDSSGNLYTLATLQASATTAIGKVDPNTPANWGIQTQGSSTSGQSGDLIMGAVTTSSPTYTTGQTNAFSLDTSGNLRTIVTNTPSVNPGTIGNWGLAASTQNGTTPTNSQLVMGQFNTSPTTITSGNVSPLQLDNAGNLLVNVKAGGGSGGTSSSFGSTFPSTGTAAGAEYLSSPPTLTTGQMVAFQTDVNGNLKVNIAAGGGSGGTSITDNSAFTQSTTAETPIGCYYVTSYTAATSGRSTVMQCDSTGHPLVNPGTIASWGLMSGTTPGTAPTNTLVIGGIYNSSAPTATTGQTLPWQLTAAGSGHVTVDNTLPPGNTNADGVATGTANASPVQSYPFLFNGTTWDRARSGGATGATMVAGAGAAGSAVAGNPVLTAGSDGTNARTVATDTKGNVKNINGASTYNTVAASQTAQVLSATQGGGTGTTGDYLSHCVIQPSTTAAGTVTIADNSTTVFTFTSGTLPGLTPIPVPIGAVSTSGGWKVTTGTNETVVCVGRFS